MENLPQAQAQETHGAIDGLMAQLATKDANGRRAVKALLLHVPAALCQQTLPGGGQAGDVCHLAAGDQREAGGRRQS